MPRGTGGSLNSDHLSTAISNRLRERSQGKRRNMSKKGHTHRLNDDPGMGAVLNHLTKRFDYLTAFSGRVTSRRKNRLSPLVVFG